MSENKSYEVRHIVISDELITYLQPSKPDHFSRCDAFHDLVMRAANSSGRVSCIGGVVDLLPGEFVVTISELSKIWGWERKRIRSFLLCLQQLHVIEIYQHDKFSVIDMVALRFKWTNDQGPLSVAWSWQSKHLEDTLVFTREKHPDTTDEVTPLVDPDYNVLYTAEQRRVVAYAFLEALKVVAVGALSTLYSPRFEKSLLDTLYKYCMGDKDILTKLILRVVESFDRRQLEHFRQSWDALLSYATETWIGLLRNGLVGKQDFTDRDAQAEPDQVKTAKPKDSP